MKKLIALAVVSISFAVHAEQWIEIQRGSNGTKLFIDNETFEKFDNNLGVPFIIAEFSYTTDGKQDPRFSFITEAASCENGGGILGQIGIQNDEAVLEAKYKWSVDGRAMYDAAGKALCDILNSKQTKSST